MLINLGKWLEQRFPKKVQVTLSDWATVVAFVDKYKDIESRLQTVESNAVHKEPVKLLVEEMAKMKAELVSLRAGLGITSSASSPESMEAMLNGQFINGGSNV